MRMKREWRSRRTLTLATAAVVVAAGASAGALDAGVVGSNKHPATATHGRQTPVWIAGEARQQAAAPVTQAPPARHRVRAVPRHAKPNTHAARRLQAAAVVNLCAKAADNVSIGATTVTIWGFVLKGAAADCSDVTAQLPGPVLNVNQGDTVTLNVTNALPAGHPISIEAPGIAFAPGPQDAAVGTTVSLSFTANAEGTYLYESSGDAGRQEAMGLFGALVVHSTTAGLAYGNAFDAEHVLVLSEIDPNLNAAPDTFNMNDWDPTLWLINGQASPDTAPITAGAGKRVLLRYANAGIDNNTMTLLGLHERMIGQDANALANPFDVVSETFPSGETAEALVAIPAGAASGTKYALYNRQLRPGMQTSVVVP
jgi:FtsP/CotA-like multicopper oxidase with cupredoxin domain